MSTDGEYRPIETQVNLCISDAVVTANQNFVHHLLTPTDQRPKYGFVNGPDMIYYGHINRILIDLATNGLNAQVSFPNEQGQKITPELYAQQLVGSILNTKPEDTVLLLLLEKSLSTPPRRHLSSYKKRMPTISSTRINRNYQRSKKLCYTSTSR